MKAMFKHFSNFMTAKPNDLDGAVQRVSMWEYITGITDAEREKMRAERLARGEPYDYDLWDDEA